jgi:hypothetical protein
LNFEETLKVDNEPKKSEFKSIWAFVNSFRKSPSVIPEQTEIELKETRVNHFETKESSDQILHS